MHVHNTYTISLIQFLSLLPSLSLSLSPRDIRHSMCQVLHDYIPQESSSSAMGQSSTPLQTKFVGMQEPSPQVKSMEGHGAKPTGCHHGKNQDSSDQRSYLVFCLTVAATFNINFREIFQFGNRNFFLLSIICKLMSNYSLLCNIKGNAADTLTFYTQIARRKRKSQGSQRD